MRLATVTEAQASSNFAAVLAAIKQGETVVITLDGAPIARVISERVIAERIAEFEQKYSLTTEVAEDHVRWIEANRALANFEPPYGRRLPDA